jgi:hypothetical protein
MDEHEVADKDEAIMARSAAPMKANLKFLRTSPNDMSRSTGSTGPITSVCR